MAGPWYALTLRSKG